MLLINPITPMTDTQLPINNRQWITKSGVSLTIDHCQLSVTVVLLTIRGLL